MSETGPGHTQGRAEWVPTRDGRRLYAMVLPDPLLPASRHSDGHAVTVVFEAGSGATRSSWALVQPAVSRFARAIVYDRSGLGRSAPDPSGRTLARMGQDLADLLDHYAPDHEGSGRFVLVGHSAGGPIVRLAASLRPGLIGGLVLVDPADEAAGILFTPLFRRAERAVLRAELLLARLGLLKLFYRRLLDAVPAPDVRADLGREGFSPGVLRTQLAQSRSFLDELGAWRAAPPHHGNVPVTVISGARPGDGMTRATRAAANASHARRAAQSHRGRHVIAERSAHYVPITDPDLIVDEVGRIVQQAKSK